MAATWKVVSYEFNLRLNIRMMRKITDQTGVDLMAMGKGAEEAQQKLLDITTFMSVMGAVCEDQVKELDLTSEQFMDLFDTTPEAYQEAMQAFATAVQDFFQERGRPELGMLHQKGRELAIAVGKAAAKKLASLNPELAVKAVEQIDINGEVERSLVRSTMPGSLSLRPPVSSATSTSGSSASES